MNAARGSVILAFMAGGREDADVLREVMDGLEMPRRGLRKWFAHDRAFCNAHGGARVYPELLELFDECDAALDELEREGK